MRTHFMLLAAVSLVMTPPASPGMDDAALKEWLTGGLFELLIWEGFDIKESGVTDEQFHRVLMELYREAEEERPAFTPKTDEWNENRLTVEGVLACLPMCGDIPVKDFLLDYAISGEKDSATRRIAVSSYLRVADANEARDALVRFLVGPDRMASDMDRSGIYAGAYTAWEGSSPVKRLAICGALQVGLAHETTHWVFCSGDRWLSGMSLKYARSKERLALLERMYAAPVPDGDLFDKRSLTPQLNAARKLKTHTSVNTNLMTAIARDFNQPLSEEDLADLAVPPPATSMPAAVPHEGSVRVGRSGLYAFGGAAAATLAAVGVWLFIRQRKASRP